MKTFPVSLPEIAFVAATRGVAGAGVGLLLSDCVAARTRKAVGWSLVALGVLTTVPIALTIKRRF